MTVSTNIPVNANQLDPGVEQLCFSSWSCQISGAVVEIWTLIAVGFAVGFVLATVAYLRAAKDELQEEQSRTAAEMQAYSKFAERVAEIQAHATVDAGSSSQGSASTMAVSSPGRSSLSNIRAIYRETVMAVPHYEEDYGESLAENMAKEFGTEVTEAVRNGQRLSPILQQALVSKATQAATQRKSLMDSLRREEQSLEAVGQSLEAIQTDLNKFNPAALRDVPYSTLRDRWEELDGLESRCQAVLENRQEDLQNEPVNKRTSDDAPSWAEYLYQSLEVTHPILATGTDLLNQIGTSRRTVSRIAATRQ